MDDIEEHKKIDRKVAKDLDNYKKINEDFNNDNKPNEQANPELPEGLQGFDNILENTSIGKIAKEITEEIDIESMTNDGDIFNFLIQKICQKYFQVLTVK